MRNKTLLKISGLFLSLGIINGITILYWYLRCLQTRSPFYCEAFAFGGILIGWGIPALILLGLAIITFAFSWYKGNVHSLIKIIIIALGVFIFIFPYFYYIFSPFNKNVDQRPKTYRGFQQMLEENRLNQEREQEDKCNELRQKVSEWRGGESMPTLPRDCE